MPNSSTSPGFPETLTLVLRTPLERLLVEQALVMAQELEAVSEHAEVGRVLDCCEEAAVAKGREFTRSALEATLQA
jgi:aminoglycoside phosphotransferase (APT) family kinase protein